MYLDEHNRFLEARAGKKGAERQPSGPGDSLAAPVVDIASGDPLPPGFQTRRAG